MECFWRFIMPAVIVNVSNQQAVRLSTDGGNAVICELDADPTSTTRQESLMA